MNTTRITVKTGSPPRLLRFRGVFQNETFVTFMLVTVAVGLGFGLAGMGVVNLGKVTELFQWGVLTIYVAMDLFTGLVVGTGIMQALAVRLARHSRGQRRAVLSLFAALLFLVSAFLNNLTAVLVVLPILFVLLSAMDLDQPFVAGFFSLLLAISNLGGAATPIGDFPAIIIMKSGLTTFSSYLFRAFPLFAITALVVTAIHLGWLRRRGGREDQAQRLDRELGIMFLGVQYRHMKVQWTNLGLLGAAFCCMFSGWLLLPADRFPPELVAIAGLGAAAVVTVPRGATLGFRTFDLKPVLTIGAFLFIAAVVSNSGLLEATARLLQSHVHHPTALLAAVMILTAVLSGLCSAGPTAAAMMPIIQFLAEGPLHGQHHWLAVAFAAAICAGSSLFLWSATAGFLLLGKVEAAGLQGKDGRWLGWGVGSYLKYGFMYFLVQLTIGMLWVLVGIRIAS